MASSGIISRLEVLGSSVVSKLLLCATAFSSAATGTAAEDIVVFRMSRCAVDMRLLALLAGAERLKKHRSHINGATIVVL